MTTANIGCTGVPTLGAPASPPAFRKNAPRSGDHTVRPPATQRSEPTP